MTVWVVFTMAHAEVVEVYASERAAQQRVDAEMKQRRRCFAQEWEVVS